jgi:NTE family protein
MRAFVAFAGGGAKGLIHVGVLRALERRKVKFCGVAGTSAGAIVAALTAAGFTSRDLVDEESERTLIHQLGEVDPKIRRATDLFGGGWCRVALFRIAMEHPRASLAFLILTVLAMPFASGLALAANFPVGAIAYVVFCFVMVWGLLSLIGGLAQVRRLRGAFGKLVQRKMFPDEPGRVVKMSDFGRDGRPTLKIVSANLTLTKLHLFSPTRTPNCPVADAVAASICLPLIFTPWRIDGHLHIDGGIVSNLPAWPFDEDRELDPEALTIAVEIAGPFEARRLNRFTWLPAAIQTGLFGSGELNLRVSGQAERLVLRSRLKLLQFNLTQRQAADEVADADRAASVKLDKRLFRRPKLYRDACSVTQALVVDVLESVLPKAVGRVRVAVSMPDHDYYKSLRLRFAVGFDDDPDEGVLLPMDGSIAGEAWRSGRARLEIAPVAPSLNLPGPENRMRRKLLWKEMKWVFCIPISDSDSGAVRLVVQIDGSIPLRRTKAVAAAFDRIDRDVTEFFNLIIRELAELEDGHGLA